MNAEEARRISEETLKNKKVVIEDALAKIYDRISVETLRGSFEARCIINTKVAEQVVAKLENEGYNCKGIWNNLYESGDLYLISWE